VAHEGNSKQHARSSRAAAEATAGEAMDLDGLPTAAGAAASPGATMHGPAVEALLEGAEYDAETGGIVGSSEAAAAAGTRPPRPVEWAAAGAAGAAKDWQMGNASAEAAMTAASGAADDGQKATEEAAARTAEGVRPPRPADWGTMERVQKVNWKKHGGKRR